MTRQNSFASTWECTHARSRQYTLAQFVHFSSFIRFNFEQVLTCVLRYAADDRTKEQVPVSEKKTAVTMTIARLVRLSSDFPFEKRPTGLLEHYRWYYGLVWRFVAVRQERNKTKSASKCIDAYFITVTFSEGRRFSLSNPPRA